MIYYWPVYHGGFAMSGYVIEITQEKENSTILESAIKSRRLLSGQHSLRRTTEKFGKANWVLYTIHQEKSILEVCRCVCGQYLWALCEESARIPKDAERLLESKIDLILVKSLSCFGRDEKETMTTIRRLKQMGIGVYIELDGINCWYVCRIWLSREPEQKQ